MHICSLPLAVLLNTAKNFKVLIINYKVVASFQKTTRGWVFKKGGIGLFEGLDGVGGSKKVWDVRGGCGV